MLHLCTNWSLSHIHITCSHMRGHGNGKECAEAIWLTLCKRSCLVSHSRTEFKEVKFTLQLTTGPALLGTMTAICHSVLLLLLIILTTITLAAQPVKGDASEGELTNPGGCISDWRGLKKAYLEHLFSADVENSIFDFSPFDAVNYGVLVMFYDVGPPPNTSTSGRRECCQRGRKDCIIHFIYRFKIFRDIHPRVLYSHTGHRFDGIATYTTNQLCWALPPFCNNKSRSTEVILYDFSQQVYLILLHSTSAIRTHQCMEL